MTSLAARLDPCANWFKLLARTRGRILWLFPGLILVGYLATLPYGDVGAGFLDHLHERRANAPLLSEARALNLDYERVLAKPEAYVGRPVVWCVDSPNPDTAYVAGRPAWPVALNGGYEYSSVGHCRNILGVVDGFKNGLIQLRPVEKL